MNLYSVFAGSEFRGDLFVEHSRRHQFHHFSLAGGQRPVAAAHFAYLPAFVTHRLVPVERLLNGVE
jgi:hypothetical protein